MTIVGVGAVLGFGMQAGDGTAIGAGAGTILGDGTAGATVASAGVGTTHGMVALAGAGTAHGMAVGAMLAIGDILQDAHGAGLRIIRMGDIMIMVSTEVDAGIIIMQWPVTA